MINLLENNSTTLDIIKLPKETERLCKFCESQAVITFYYSDSEEFRFASIDLCNSCKVIIIKGLDV